ncbi:MAG: GNAT family N-acetyltransferase [Acidimicrobiales bacterium]
MAGIELRRITDDAAAKPCDQLFREYAAWVLEQFRSLHGVPFDELTTEQVHASFQAEWPKLFGNRGRLYLALVDDGPAGVAGLKPVSATTAELKRMYVRPAHRGAGLARRLINRILADARLLGYQTVVLETADFMTDAHRLYRSVGFCDTERFDGAEGAAHGVAAHELFMQLDLNRALEPKPDPT